MSLERNPIRSELTEHDKKMFALGFRLEGLKRQYAMLQIELIRATKWGKFEKGMTIEELTRQNEIVRIELEKVEEEIEQEGGSLNQSH